MFFLWFYFLVTVISGKWIMMCIAPGGWCAKIPLLHSCRLESSIWHFVVSVNAVGCVVCVQDISLQFFWFISSLIFYSLSDFLVCCLCGIYSWSYNRIPRFYGFIVSFLSFCGLMLCVGFVCLGFWLSFSFLACLVSHNWLVLNTIIFTCYCCWGFLAPRISGYKCDILMCFFGDLIGDYVFIVFF